MLVSVLSMFSLWLASIDLCWVSVSIFGQCFVNIGYFWGKCLISVWSMVSQCTNRTI